MARKFSKYLLSLLIAAVMALCAVATAFASEPQSDAVSSTETIAQSPVDSVDYDVLVSASKEEAYIEGASFAASDFTRALKGSNREIDGKYFGYSYYQGSNSDYAVAIVTHSGVIVYLPEAVHSICDISDETSRMELIAYLRALDQADEKTRSAIQGDMDWHFTSSKELIVGNVKYSFDVEATSGKFYVCVSGPDGEDVTSGSDHAGNQPVYVDFARIVYPDEVNIVAKATGFAAFAEFLSGIDYSPLWVTLKTTGCAIAFIFILGLAAAYLTLRVSKRARDIFDTIFTIPMVLPPTVCGFLLLLLLGRNTALGQWFIDVGFPLVFSWPATVIAATVVAFPLMYRSSRGAFEGLDSDMLDAARTLGWSNARIFFKLMIPLSWSSIAAATVLAFARALGEFGATLFLAGNYAGITRTIPIAIYFEWMGGNMDVAIFWTVIIIIFSFIVILLINLWSRKTTEYRRGSRDR